MKKCTIFLVISAVVLSAVVIASARHERMIFPYEGIFGHYETMPQPDAGDLRHYITSHVPYKKEFTLWPGKPEMFEGKEPHGSFLTIYVNDIGLKSINKTSFDNNSIVLKENYTPDKKLAAITVMYKVKGYNPGGGDWFWVNYDADFKILEKGKVKACLGCHSDAKDKDYVFNK
jgi:hypothetical protein